MSDDDIFAEFRDRTCRAEPSCTNNRIVWKVTTNLPDPKACYGHLTEEQRRAYDRVTAEVQKMLERLAREPDCWSWPVPEPREYATEEEASDALHEWQLDRGCAICGARFNLVEDHDHHTGLVRGNLCRSCNIKEGWGAESVPFVKYRQRPPAAILGVKVRYWSPFHGYNTELPPPTEEDMRHARAVLEARTLPRPEDLTRSETTP